MTCNDVSSWFGGCSTSIWVATPSLKATECLKQTREDDLKHDLAVSRLPTRAANQPIHYCKPRHGLLWLVIYCVVGVYRSHIACLLVTPLQMQWVCCDLSTQVTLLSKYNDPQDS